MPLRNASFQTNLAADVGVFDSGLGGLSVLRALQAAMPQARFDYFADSGNAPYGERDDAFVLARSRAIAALLIERGASMLVVACNTATAVAIEALRNEWPRVPIIGVEPGVKPAVAITRNGRIGVMGTRVTLSSDRYRRLLEREAAGVTVHTQPCDGLAAAIEGGTNASADALDESIARHCRPLLEADVDTVVLGCTHYPFVRDAIEAQFPRGVQIVDTADAIARQAAKRSVECAARSAREADAQVATRARLRMSTTGDEEVLKRFAKRWLAVPATGEEIT